MHLELLKHQADFVSDTTTRNLSLIGGYGSGKTKALALKLITLALKNPGCDGIALSPTYQMATKVLIPTIEQELRDHGIAFQFNKTEMIFRIRVKGTETRIHILAAETYKRAAGINAAFFGIDEADLLNLDTFVAAWMMLSSRLRKGKVFQGVAVSTPEGFRGCYKFWVEDIAQNPKLAKDRRMIKASTYDNHFLPREYIEGLEAQYPEHLIKAYLHGEFVNLAGRPVYWKFDKELNVISKTIADFPQHVIHVGIDFNKGINATVIHVVKNNQSFAIDEIYGAHDTQLLSDEIKRRYPWHVQNNAIRLYPDAAGFEGIQTLKRNFAEFGPDGKANFRTAAKDIEKRVAAVNTKFKPVGSGPESFVNAAKCPELYKGLIQQTYNRSEEPDTKSGVEHALDAHGYFIVKTWALTGHVTARVS
jgi:PBSX family phage terminase large subunit